MSKAIETNTRKSESSKRNLSYSELSVLIKENLATQIISQKEYNDTFGQHAERFNPNLFQEVHVVQVRTADGIKTLIRDGHHRTKAVFDNYQKLIGTTTEPGLYPDFKFKIHDITDELLKDPLIVSQSSQPPTELTMLQYLLAVIPPTKKHIDIAPERTAASLMLGWENIAGRELAEKYPALVILNLFAREDSPSIANPDMYLKDVEQIEDDTRRKKAQQSKKQFISYIDSIFTSTDPVQHEKLQNAFFDIANVMSATGLSRSDIALQANGLVGNHPERIGGETVANKQLLGFLYLPVVQTKLETYAPTSQERMNIQKQLEHNLLLFKRERNMTIYIKDLLELLIQPRFSIVDIKNFLTQPKVFTYQKILKDLEVKTLTNEFVKLKGDDTLSNFQQHFLQKRLSSHLILPAEQAMIAATELLNHLPSEYSIERKNIQEAKDSLFKTQRASAPQKILALNKLIHEINAKITNQTPQRPKSVEPVKPVVFPPSDEALEQAFEKLSAQRDKATKNERQALEKARQTEEQLAISEADNAELKAQLAIAVLISSNLRDRIGQREASQPIDWQTITRKQASLFIQQSARAIFGENLEKEASSYLKSNESGRTLRTINLIYTQSFLSVMQHMESDLTEAQTRYLAANIYMMAVDSHVEKVTSRKTHKYAGEVTVYRQGQTPREGIVINTNENLLQFRNILQQKMNQFTNENLSPNQQRLTNILGVIFQLEGNERSLCLSLLQQEDGVIKMLAELKKYQK